MVGPPGWAHSVLNVRPSIKLAIETARLEDAALYLVIANLIAKYFAKPDAAADYFAYQSMLFGTLDEMCN